MKYGLSVKFGQIKIIFYEKMWKEQTGHHGDYWVSIMEPSGDSLVCEKEVNYLSFGPDWIDSLLWNAAFL